MRQLGIMTAVPRPSRLKPLDWVGIAAAAGLGWGIVMALVAFLRDGTEIVLLQAFILVPAWFFGHATREARAGALAGLALVATAVYAFELLPMWGVEATLRREAPAASPGELDALAVQVDRQDIALFSTLAIGALIGLAGGRQGRPAQAADAVATAPSPAVAPPPPPAPPDPPPAPLWAGYGRPAPAPAEPPRWLAPQPPAPPAAPPEQPRFVQARGRTPWGVAFLMAAATTDLGFDRLFEMYTTPQATVAAGFALAGCGATAWFARRHTLAMVVAGVILASAFAVVQHAEYEERRSPVPRAVQ